MKRTRVRLGVGRSEAEFGPGAWSMQIGRGRSVRRSRSDGQQGGRAGLNQERRAGKQRIQ